jgi:hypothetical protein
MGNPNTGEIYELGPGEKPREGDVALTADQAERLRALSDELRKAELGEMVKLQRKPTIAELEAILNQRDVDIQISPDGSTVTAGPLTSKPLTMHENLGGEYSR